MRRSAVLLIVLALAGFVVPPRASAVTDDNEIHIRTSIERSVFQVVNRVRKKAELRKLDENGVIRREVRLHSIDMADDKEVDHDNFDDRVQNIVHDDRGIDGGRLCELVTRIVGSSNAGRRIVERFGDSDAGRACLLDRNFSTQSVGIGVASLGRRIYATLIVANDETVR